MSTHALMTAMISSHSPSTLVNMAFVLIRKATSAAYDADCLGDQVADKLAGAYRGDGERQPACPTLSHPKTWAASGIGGYCGTAGAHRPYPECACLRLDADTAADPYVSRSWWGRSQSACRQPCWLAFVEEPPPPGLRHGVAQKRGFEHEQSASRSALRGSITNKEVVMHVMITAQGIAHSGGHRRG